MRFVENVLAVLFGTVRRAQWTLGVLTGIYLLVHPSVVTTLLTGFLEAITPLVPKVLEISIMAFGAAFLLRRVFGRRGSKKSPS